MFDLARIGAGLPVAETIDSLPSTGNVVIQAPPGTGKTTLVPPALANHAAGRGKVIVTAPRRVAVRAAAQRLSTLSGTPDKVGFAIRGESRRGSDVEFVTPGVLLRRLLKDPELEGVVAVAIDEVHERQLDTDLVLGMCLELAELREDFRVIAMSATVDAQRFSQLMDAPVHVTEAVTHPLDFQYSPMPGRAAGTREFYGDVAKQAARQQESTLVFVPGVREVNLVCDALAGHNVFPLHGKQTTAEQDAALYTDEQRIVVATSIAESSLTVPGVRVVVDAGLSRVPRRDAQRGMSGLVTVSTSKSSADQRAGRAGREAPGTVIRCYSQDDYQHFSPHTTPEILSADLTQAALFLDCWGAGPDFPLLDPPPAQALASAQATLKRIGATQELALLPTDPRLGASLLRHGSQAAPLLASLADAPLTPDLTRHRPPQREVKRLARLVEDLGPADSGEVVATAFPEQVAKRMGEDYLLASGTRARLLDSSGLTGSPWLAIAEVSLSNAGNAIIRSAARIEETAALAAIGVTEETRAFLRDGRVRGVKVKAAGAITLSETPVKVTGPAAEGALAAGIREEGLGLFTFSEKAQSLKDRLRHLHAHFGEPWPDVEQADPAEWLGSELHRIAEGTPPPSSTCTPRCNAFCPGQKPPTWTSSPLNASQSPPAETHESTGPAIAPWFTSSYKNASAWPHLPNTAATACNSTCSPPPGGHSR